MAETRTSNYYKRQRLRRIVILFQVVILLTVAALVGIVGGTLYSVWGIIPDDASIKNYTPSEGTKIISSDGVVLARISEENREYIPITEIPENMQHAIVAIEDKRFYQHSGINFRAIGRALVENLQRHKFAQGGSTITQQLARNIYLTRKKTMSRKLQEVMLALRIERAYSKEQILEMYLNQVYFGSGSYGVETAAETYFGKKAKDLTLAQCALIAGLPQRPSSYSPFEHEDLAVRRRNVVLDCMAEQGYISYTEAENAKAEPVRLVRQKRKKNTVNYKAPYFVSYVLNQLIDRYGADLIYKGGLMVYTTLNYQMQQVAEKEIAQALRDGGRKKISQMALLSIDPHTGNIRAMVGGKDFSESQFNRAIQAKRQPGSSFKLFVYTAAIESGWGPNTRVLDAPLSFPGANGHSWRPQNQDHRSYGWMSMKRAVALSVNRPAVWTLQKIGIPKVINYARMMGIKQPLDPTLPLALGASDVTLIEMTSAYGIIDADGEKVEPNCILRITDRSGGLIDQPTPEHSRVLSSETCSKVKELLRAVVTQGTGRGANSVPDAYGKTGTTQRDVDAWFIGFTPDLVTGVWAGNDSRVAMNKAYGGSACVPVWTDFMKEAIRINQEAKQHEGEQQRSKNPNPYNDTLSHRNIDNKSNDIKTKETSDEVRVSICDESGLVATKSCPHTHIVTYKRGDEPTETCNIHGGDRNNSEENPTEETRPSVNTAPSSPAERPQTIPEERTQTKRAPKAKQETVELTICATSHKIANDYCPRTITKRFPVNRAPQEVCDIHGPE